MSMCSLRPFALVLGLAASSATAEPVTHYSVSPDARGAWSFVAANGERVLSLGINNVSSEPYKPRPGTDYYNPVPDLFKGDKAAWGTWVHDLLTSNGINTAGAWSSAAVPGSERLWHTPILYIGDTPFHQCLDAFRPDFPKRAAANAVKVMANFPDRARVLGVFLDNEMPWYGKSGWDRTTTYTLLERALEEAPDEPARVAALAYLQSRHASAPAFAAAAGVELKDWSALTPGVLRLAQGEAIAADRAGFIALVAERYYRLGTEAVRAALPGVLILGTRFAGDVPDPVIVACGKYCDVISFNDYHGDPTAPADLIARYWLLGKRPLMITEFAWRAKENASGNPNSAGAGAVVPTQADRAERYAKYIAACLRSPVVIGMHWFEFADQSPQGRFDGENSNYGIVSIRNEPYTTVLESMKRAHAAIPALRAGPLLAVPTALPVPPAVAYNPGQHPGRPPTLDLLAGPSAGEMEVWGAPDAKITVRREPGAMILDYTAGTAYGAGVNIFGPSTSRNPAGPSFATDLDGYIELVLEATAPKGIQMNLVMTESGAGPVGQLSYASPAGDDGEAFISDAFYGSGQRRVYRVRIADLRKQQFWGNQAGGNTIEMSAVRCLGLQIQGSPPSGTVTIHRWHLER
ncbi:MAG: hypothetical protein ACT4PL_07895 [Phycisphaerales bacterium]